MTRYDNDDNNYDEDDRDDDHHHYDHDHDDQRTCAQCPLSQRTRPLQTV